MASAIAKLSGRDSAFLGVERSLTGRRWRARDADLGQVEALRRRFALPEIAARLLAARGVTPDEAERFLDPTLKALFPDPSSFTDMDEAARVIEDAIVSGLASAVLADYDVDLERQVDEAMAALDRFDREWWFANGRRANGLLIVTLG